MKTYIYFLTAAIMLTAASCRKDLAFSEPDFEVSVAQDQYQVGDTVEFIFKGNPDYLTFFSGESGNNYANRERTSVTGTPKISFTSFAQYGTQQNTLSLLVSTDFNGKVDADIAQATWTDITAQAKLSTGADNTPSGEIDLSPFADGDKTVLSQVYTVSAYDSGEYHAGPVKIYFANSNGELDSALSNDIIVTVNTLDVDTAKPFKAIKAPLEVPYTWQEFIYYIIAGLLLIIAIVVAILLWKKYKKKKPVVVERPKPKDPAHIWARRELKKLEEEKLWQKNETKLYYSRLTDILRYYLEFRYGWYAMESTTEEIEEEMGNYKLKEKAKENLLAILRAADLVKFAKMIPLPDANMKAMENAYKFIDFTEPAENRVEKK